MSGRPQAKKASVPCRIAGCPRIGGQQKRWCCTFHHGWLKERGLLDTVAPTEKMKEAGPSKATGKPAKRASAKRPPASSSSSSANTPEPAAKPLPPVRTSPRPDAVEPPAHPVRLSIFERWPLANLYRPPGDDYGELLVGPFTTDRYDRLFIVPPGLADGVLVIGRRPSSVEPVFFVADAPAPLSCVDLNNAIRAVLNASPANPSAELVQAWTLAIHQYALTVWSAATGAP